MKLSIFLLTLTNIAFATSQTTTTERSRACSFRPQICRRMAMAATATKVAPTTMPTFAPAYQECGGHVVNPKTCPKGYICVDNPWTCSQAVDCPGICVKPRACGGFAGTPCPKGKKCYDDPRDDCDPATGADCIGICI